MATSTTHLGLRKPDPEDLVNVSTDISSNMDILDAALVTLEQKTVLNSYTLSIEDAGAMVEGDSTSAINIIVPPDSVIPFPLGTVVNVCQVNTGSLTIVAGSGVSLRNPSTSNALFGRWSSAAIRKRAANEWVLSGDFAV